MSFSSQFPLAGHAVRLARRGAEHAAERIEAEAPRIATLTEAGLRASEVSYRALERLVRQGLESARGALTDGAARLRLTAQSESLAELYDAQRATLPASRARIAKELEAAWAIVRATGEELAAVARAVREELAQSSSSHRQARARKPRSRGQGQRDHSGRASPPGL